MPPATASKGQLLAERAPRRSFLPEYKLDVLDTYARLEPAAKREFLRREGLQSSTISAWRRQRELGRLKGQDDTAETKLSQPRISERNGRRQQSKSTSKVPGPSK